MLYLSTLYAKFISAINYLINDGEIICIIQYVYIYIHIYTPLAYVLLCCGCVVAQLIGYHGPLGLNIFLNVATIAAPLP